MTLLFFFSSRRRHTRYWRDWSSDVCSSDLKFSTLFNIFSLLKSILSKAIVISLILGVMSATEVEISLNDSNELSTVDLCSFNSKFIFSVSLTIALVLFNKFPMILYMLVEDSLLLSAKTLISSATTAKPLPDSPALAASIAAFNASRLVCSAILFIKSVISFTVFISPFISLILLEKLAKFLLKFSREFINFCISILLFSEFLLIFIDIILILSTCALISEI